MTDLSRWPVASHLKCQICNNNKLIPIYSVDQKGFSYLMYRCRCCSHLQVGRTQLPPEYKQESQDYFSDVDASCDQCDQTWAKLNDAWGRCRQNAFKNIFNNLKKLGFAKGTMLDIGSAFGHMLNMAINEGFSVLGVEPSRLARQVAYEKFKIQSVKDIDDINHGSRFDVILCLETLYYCYDARQMLDSIRQKLSSSGCLVLKMRSNRTNLFRLCAALNILLKRKLLCVRPGTLLYGYSLRGYHL